MISWDHKVFNDNVFDDISARGILTSPTVDTSFPVKFYPRQGALAYDKTVNGLFYGDGLQWNQVSTSGSGHPWNIGTDFGLTYYKQDLDYPGAATAPDLIYGSQTSMSTSVPPADTTRLMFINGGLRAGTASGNQWDVLGGNSVAFGSDNTVESVNSSATGGSGNTIAANAPQSAIVTGENNSIIFASSSSILGGNNGEINGNTVFGGPAEIVGSSIISGTGIVARRSYTGYTTNLAMSSGTRDGIEFLTYQTTLPTLIGVSVGPGTVSGVMGPNSTDVCGRIEISTTHVPGFIIGDWVRLGFARTLSISFPYPTITAREGPEMYTGQLYIRGVTTDSFDIVFGASIPETFVEIYYHVISIDDGLINP